MIFIFLLLFREIFGLNDNQRIFLLDLLDGMETMDDNLGAIQPRFNATCDETSLDAAIECEAKFIIFWSNFA